MPPRRAATRCGHGVEAPEKVHIVAQGVQGGPTSGNQQVQPQHEAFSDSIKLFLKLQPLQFDGTDDFDQAERWMEAMEDIFKLMPCSEARKVLYATYCLTEDAHDWWMSTKTTKFDNQDIIPWPEFKEAFQTRYLPEYKRDMKMDEFLRLKQEDMAVSQYLTRYIQLEKYCTMRRDEERRAYHFVQGLNPELNMIGGNYKTLYDAVRIATLIEMCNTELQKDQKGKAPARPIDQNKPRWEGRHQSRRDGRRDNRLRPYAPCNTPHQQQQRLQRQQQPQRQQHSQRQPQPQPQERDSFSAMVKSKFENVRDFEADDRLPPCNWIVVRINGCNFHKFSADHLFEKPNDKNALNLMNACAVSLLKHFPDIVFAYGISDEYSFILKESTQIYERRASKILSLLVSYFTSMYVIKWKEFFPSLDLKGTPYFDGRVFCYPGAQPILDYLALRQGLYHMNNQSSTCFWMLVKSGKTKKEAHEFLEFNINYDNIPEMFRKGSIVYRRKDGGGVMSENGQNYVTRVQSIVVEHEDIIGPNFWNDHPYILKEE